MSLKCLANSSCEVPGNLRSTESVCLEVGTKDLLIFYVISVHYVELEIKTIQGLISLFNLILVLFKRGDRGSPVVGRSLVRSPLM